MTLIERLEAELKEAMKQREELRTSVLRLVRSALKNKQIDLGHAMTDAEAQAVIAGMVKQYRDALSDFQSAGRRDLVEKQQAELVLLEAYLPAPLPDEDLDRVCQEVIKELGITDAKSMGRAIGEVVKRVEGRADGSRIRASIEKQMPKA